jgi:PKD repeat protein
MKYFAFTLLFLIASCGSPPVPPVPSEGEVQFYFQGKVNGVDTKWEAGRNNYYMQTGFDISANNDIVGLYGKLKELNKVGNTIEIYFPSLSVGANVSDILKVQSYPIFAILSASDSGTVRFQAQNTGTNPTYLWDFGDGTTSTLANPTHIFPNPNQSYSISLSTNNGTCSSILAQTITPAQLNCYPTFVATVAGFERNIQFQTTESNVVWNFGDNTTSTQANPTHLYASKGVFTVSMQSLDCGEKVAQNIQVGEIGGCGINFSYQKTQPINPPLIVRYTDANGLLFSSDKVEQDAQAFFTITKIEDYTSNSEKLKKINLSFELKVKADNGQVKNIVGEKVVFAVGIPQ